MKDYGNSCRNTKYILNALKLIMGEIDDRAVFNIHGKF